MSPRLPYYMVGEGTSGKRAGKHVDNHVLARFMPTLRVTSTIIALSLALALCAYALTGLLHACAPHQASYACGDSCMHQAAHARACGERGRSPRLHIDEGRFRWDLSTAYAQIEALSVEQRCQWVVSVGSSAALPLVLVGNSMVNSFALLAHLILNLISSPWRSYSKQAGDSQQTGHLQHLTQAAPRPRPSQAAQAVTACQASNAQALPPPVRGASLRHRLLRVWYTEALLQRLSLPIQRLSYGSDSA